MRIATWNVNSIKARLNLVLDWLKTTSPDVALFQEIKTIEGNFPALEIGDLGYNFACFGQKSYNGVAILSKTPIEDVKRGLDGDPADEQARYIEAVVYGSSRPVRVASIYLPNGNPLGSEKFAYKLRWMERLRAHAAMLLRNEEVQILAGDYNVIPTAEDCHDPKAWMNDALFQPESRAGLRRILHLGFTDAYRACHVAPHRYTFWDYQAGAWEKDHGIRIDFALASPQAADLLKGCEIERSMRGKEKASDHVPVVVELDA